jgi:hypothetical protein
MNNKLKQIKAILSSGFNNKEINEDDFKKLIQTDYSEAWNNYVNDIIFYRGIDNSIKTKIFISSPKLRQSIPDVYSGDESINFYTTLFSEVLPSWSKYPKRNHSIICINDSDLSEEYGNTYIIFPKNGSIIGGCPESDIWYSFEKFLDLKLFEEYLKIIMKCIEYNKNIFNNKEDILDFFDYFSKHDPVNNVEMEEIPQIKELYILMVKNKNNLIKLFDNILNPKKNDFALFKNKNFPEIDEGHELWFDNEYLAIVYTNEMFEFLEKLK